MKATIWKSEIPLRDHVEIPLPVGAKILSLQNQDDKMVIWYIFDTTDEELVFKHRYFRIIGTGHPVENYQDNWEFIGTCQLKEGLLVLHIFEVPY